MAQSKKLITKETRLHNARQLLESVNEPSNTAYYTFIGNHLDYANTTFIPQPLDSVGEVHIDVYRNMIYGKRLSSDDISLMIKRNDYTTNTVFTMYDDTLGESNLALFDSNYYAIVNADAFYHVFKCLDNNRNSVSTVQPEFSEIDVNDELYQTSDGYTWKYIYTVDSTTASKFSTSEYFPVIANSQVSKAAKTGIIDVIKVETVGSGYDNYCNGVFKTDDLRIGGNVLSYSLNSSVGANTTSRFYNGCYIYISSGTGAGQYAKIDDYVVNSTVKAITLDRAFAIKPLSDSAYQVSPGVLITGDGNETVTAEARAIVNTFGNSIQRIEMLELGADYTYAKATILTDPVVGIDATATLRPIYSPPGGHGYDAAKELGATRLCISTKFSNSDVGVPLSNDYRTIGILKDPVFANVTFNITDATGSFIAGEQIYKVNGVKISSNASIDSANASVTSPNDDFLNQVSIGEYIYFKTSSGYQLSVVNSIVNSSHMTLVTNNYYSCTSAEMYKTNIGANLTSVNLTYSNVLTGNVSVNTTSANLNGTGTSFTTQLVANSSLLFIYSASGGGGTIRKVLSVANDTLAILDSNCSFANATAKEQPIGYTINSTVSPEIGASVGMITSVAAGTFDATHVSGDFKTGDYVIGSNSGAFATVNSIMRSGVYKNFNTFIQMYKYNAIPVSGNFTGDEAVYQSTTGSIRGQFANAYFHSVVDSDTNKDYYVTNQIGVFQVGIPIIGTSNTAPKANIVNKYSPELVFGSGKVMYLEKLDAISRTNTAAETIKFIFEF
jgi:hypothetical protein